MRNLPALGHPDQDVHEVVGIALMVVEIEPARQPRQPAVEDDESQKPDRQNCLIPPAHSPSFFIIWPQ